MRPPARRRSALLVAVLMAGGGLVSATAPAAAAARSPLATSGGRFLAQSVSFPSTVSGWLLGVDRCGPHWCTALLRTADRGRRWSVVPPPPAAVGPSGGTGRATVSQLVAASPGDLFAYGPGLVTTHDGGGDWDRVHLPGAVVAVAAGESFAYAAVMPCYGAPGACVMPGHLYRTPVGRDAWRAVAGVTFAAQSAPEIATSGTAVVVLAADASRPQLLGAPDGLHFAILHNPCPAPTPAGGFAPGAVALGSARSVAVLCVGGAGAGSVEKAAYVSTTFGRTFQRIADPPLGGDPGQLAAASPTTLVLAAASGATWLYRTTGPDSRWTTAREFGDGGVGFTDLSFSDPLHGAAVYGQATLAETLTSGAPAHLASVFLTDNGGRTWFPIAA